jgi:hypothetical protein
MNERTRRMVAALGLGLLCGGCSPRPCPATAAAAVALDAACTSAGVAHHDPALLLVCTTAYASVKRALETGACAVELKK